MIYFTVDEVAKLWKSGRHTVLSAITSGRLKAFRLNPKSTKSPWRIPESSLKEHDELCCGRIPQPQKKTTRKPKKASGFEEIW
ncbi:helix-turn-helix domain-containing protein [Planctomicrobium sp. SH668]|uniref:helix-turn-helix domain-containing protein n=1 Tax=Planctomicrobium sp. SH668 TaxID=3448126 RepID=UPI003F5C0CA4